MLQTHTADTLTLTWSCICFLTHSPCISVLVSTVTQSHLIITAAALKYHENFTNLKVYSPFSVLRMTMNISYLSHVEQVSLDTFEYVDCGRNSTIPHPVRWWNRSERLRVWSDEYSGTFSSCVCDVNDDYCENAYYYILYVVLAYLEINHYNVIFFKNRCFKCTFMFFFLIVSVMSSTQNRRTVCFFLKM